MSNYPLPITYNQSRSLRMKFRASEGFTLIEMIVSLAIFSVVAVVALGALMKIISANKKAQSLMSAMTNISFALESMSREMRVGSEFHCEDGKNGSGNATFNTNSYSAKACSEDTPPSPSTDKIGTVIAFRSAKTIIDTSVTPNVPCNLIYAYRFQYKSDRGGWDIQKAEQPENSNSCGGTLGSGGEDFSSIIDPNVVITNYYVNVSASPDDTLAYYPLATIRISGYVGARERERTYFDVQTAVSARAQTNPKH